MIRKDDINCICIRVKERQMENILLLLIWMVFINIASGMTQLLNRITMFKYFFPFRRISF